MGRFAGYLCAIIIGVFLSPIFKLVLKVPLRIVEDAVAGWINRQISEAYGMTSPSLADIVKIVSEWGPAFLVALLIGWLMVLASRSQFAPATRSSPNLPGGQSEPQNETHKFASADLDEWRNVDLLELFRAGCLWKGFQPHYPIGFNDPSYASYIMLVNAAKAGQLTVTNPGTEVDAWSLVNRSELARFARSKGEMPGFLRGVAIEEAALSPIRMSIGKSGPYFKTDGSVYGIRRTYNLKLENTAQSKSLSDCSVQILSVTPPTDYEGPWRLGKGLELASGDYVFIPLVTYGEAREPNKGTRGDTFITMGTEKGHPYLDVGPK